MRLLDSYLRSVDTALLNCNSNYENLTQFSLVHLEVLQCFLNAFSVSTGIALKGQSKYLEDIRDYLTLCKAQHVCDSISASLTSCYRELSANRRKFVSARAGLSMELSKNGTRVTKVNSTLLGAQYSTQRKYSSQLLTGNVVGAALVTNVFGKDERVSEEYVASLKLSIRNYSEEVIKKINLFQDGKLLAVSNIAATHSIFLRSLVHKLVQYVSDNENKHCSLAQDVSSLLDWENNTVDSPEQHQQSYRTGSFKRRKTA